MVDNNKASVPLSDIVFETFGRSLARDIPFDQSDEEFILGRPTFCRDLS